MKRFNILLITIIVSSLTLNARENGNDLNKGYRFYMK